MYVSENRFLNEALRLKLFRNVLSDDFVNILTYAIPLISLEVFFALLAKFKPRFEEGRNIPRIPRSLLWNKS